MDKMRVFVSVWCFCLLISLHRNTMLLNYYTMIPYKEGKAILYSKTEYLYFLCLLKTPVVL